MGLSQEGLRKGDAEYVAPRVETRQFEEVIALSASDAVRDAIESYFNGRLAAAMQQKIQKGGALNLEDETNEKKVFYMFQERGAKVKLSFKNMSDDEALIVTNEVRAVAGLESTTTLTKAE